MQFLIAKIVFLCLCLSYQPAEFIEFAASAATLQEIIFQGPTRWWYWIYLYVCFCWLVLYFFIYLFKEIINIFKGTNLVKALNVPYLPHLVFLAHETEKGWEQPLVDSIKEHNLDQSENFDLIRSENFDRAHFDRERLNWCCPTLDQVGIQLTGWDNLKVFL